MRMCDIKNENCKYMITNTRCILILFLLLVNLPMTLGEASDNLQDNTLPRVLLIGDSISLGYTNDVCEMLKGIANVYRPPVNCMHSAYVAENIKNWLSDGKWDVVHFNAGIWDCHYLDKNNNIISDEGRGAVSDSSGMKRIRTSLEEYEKNLNIILDAIVSAGAIPIFASTTLVPRWNEEQRAHLRSLNEVAKSLMFYKQVQVNDLYNYSLPNLKEWQANDQAHFTSSGYKKLAKKVSEEILKALQSEATILDWKPIQTRQNILHQREVIRYEHDCLKRWGYEQPHEEFFYVMKPGMPLSKNPLVVFLHSAGGNGETELEANVRRIAGFGDEFVGLALNSPHTLAELENDEANQDWWWGAKAIQKKPKRYKNEMTPIENRVLETIEWVIQNYNIDRDRVYMRGVSMGGSGTLGIGLAHGDVFAALQTDVFAGVEHAVYRLNDAKFDPPYLSMVFSHLDSWSKGAEQLLNKISTEYLGASYAWDIYEHDHKVHHEKANQFVVHFPWLSIRRNQAYPVFLNASSDDSYPGHMSEEPDQRGQKNAYFSWSVLEDTENRFVIELRLVNKLQFVNNIPSPSEWEQMRIPITTDVTLRRLQNFKVGSDLNESYNWVIESEGRIRSRGQISPNDKGLLTVGNIEIGLAPIQLIITQF